MIKQTSLFLLHPLPYLYAQLTADRKIHSVYRNSAKLFVLQPLQFSYWIYTQISVTSGWYVGILESLVYFKVFGLVCMACSYVGVMQSLNKALLHTVVCCACIARIRKRIRATCEKNVLSIKVRILRKILTFFSEFET